MLAATPALSLSGYPEKNQAATDIKMRLIFIVPAAAICPCGAGRRAGRGACRRVPFA